MAFILKEILEKMLQSIQFFKNWKIFHSINGVSCDRLQHILFEALSSVPFLQILDPIKSLFSFLIQMYSSSTLKKSPGSILTTVMFWDYTYFLIVFFYPFIMIKRVKGILCLENLWNACFACRDLVRTTGEPWTEPDQVTIRTVLHTVPVQYSAVQDKAVRYRCSTILYAHFFWRTVPVRLNQWWWS
jgi:hypothetical protein